MAESADLLQLDRESCGVRERGSEEIRRREWIRRNKDKERCWMKIRGWRECGLLQLDEESCGEERAAVKR